jgi:signal transduction histidine kinase
MGIRAADGDAEGRGLDELRAALRRKSELLAVVAHDMRSPLHSIKLGAAHLERLLGGGDGPARRKAASISAQADRLVRIVGDLLDAGCIEAGKLAVSPRAVRARDIVAGTVEDLGPVAEERRIVLLAGELPEKARVLCDRHRIDQVFENLVGNALKFTDEGGEVTLGAQHEGKQVVFSVRDTGPGIAPSELPRIFECWYRGRAHESRGTGLGLFIARGIVEAHRGRLWAESRRGEGAVFRFTLPAA